MPEQFLDSGTDYFTLHTFYWKQTAAVQFNTSRYVSVFKTAKPAKIIQERFNLKIICFRHVRVGFNSDPQKQNCSKSILKQANSITYCNSNQNVCVQK